MIDADRAARLLSTWFGSGYSPVAPGTMGSLATLPLHVLLNALGTGPYVAATAGLTVLGVWAANRTAKGLNEHDPQQVVIDEVAGTLIALSFVLGRGAKRQLLALLLFRVLDITKPGPIDTVQRAKPWGVGIMADDVLAGLAAGGLTRLLGRLIR
jgi:phosphatidylglycerophosphatase A